jgi:hypothetical protein
MGCIVIEEETRSHWIFLPADGQPITCSCNQMPTERLQELSVMEPTQR